MKSQSGTIPDSFTESLRNGTGAALALARSARYAFARGARVGNRRQETGREILRSPKAPNCRSSSGPPLFKILIFNTKTLTRRHMHEGATR